MTKYLTRIRRWTRAEYDRLIELGILGEDEHVELIGGELIVSEPQSPEHYTAVRKCARALDAAFGPGWDVRMVGPINLDDESEPEPDIAVVPGTLEDYTHEHPARPVLTLEVSLSSLAFDRVRKASVYARAGLDDYWVLDLVNRRLEVYREPVTDATAPYGWRYARRDVLEASGLIAPLAAPTASISVADLLP